MSTLYSYTYTCSGFNGDSPGFIGDSPGFIGDSPGFIGDSPGFIGDSPVFIGDSPVFIGDSPVFIGDSPVFIVGSCRIPPVLACNFIMVFHPNHSAVLPVLLRCPGPVLSLGLCHPSPMILPLPPPPYQSLSASSSVQAFPAFHTYLLPFQPSLRWYFSACHLHYSLSQPSLLQSFPSNRRRGWFSVSQPPTFSLVRWVQGCLYGAGGLL